MQSALHPPALPEPSPFTIPSMLSIIRVPFNKRRQHSDIKYLQFTRFENYRNRNYDDDNGSDGDTSSIESVSTNATMDNNPGTGRTIDTYLYQFFGRKIERLIFRVSIANLSLDRILHFLWGNIVAYPSAPSPLGVVIQSFRRGEELAGLKSLVKQSQ